MTQFIKKRLVKITLWLFASILFLFITVASALQVPYFQTKLVTYLSKVITKSTGFKTTISKVSIDWFDQINLKGISVVDPEGNQMANIKQAIINYQISSLLSETEINIDQLDVNTANIFLTKLEVNDSTEDININQYIKRLKELFKKERPNKKKKLISIDVINLAKSSFSYWNPKKDSLFGKFDYHHFTINNIKSTIRDFSVKNDTTAFNIRDLHGQNEATGLKIHQLQTNFSVSQRRMEFKNLNSLIGDSKITDNIVFNYQTLKDLNDFNNRIRINARLNKSIIFTNDLALFAPSAKKINKKLTVSGNFLGRISRFTFKDFILIFDKTNAIKGRLTMYGLPDIDETFIDINLKQSIIKIKDISPLFKPKTQKYFEPFTQASFTGKFIGYINDFVASGNFITDLGKINSNINLKVYEDKSFPHYSGRLKLTDFDLEKLSGNSLLGLVSMDGKIAGKGLTFNTADFELEGDISSIGINNYDYTNIKTDARFSEKFFNGTLSINDPNLQFDMDGSIDLRESKNEYDVAINLKRSYLHNINITKDKVFAVSDIKINARGIELDDLVGEAHFSNTLIDYNNVPLVFNQFDLTSEISNKERKVKLISDLVDFEAYGNFHYTKLIKQLTTLYKEYQLNINNDYEALQAYYQNKPKQSDENFDVNYHIKLKDVNPILNLIPGEFNISNDVAIQGMFQSGNTSMLSINTSIDTLTFNGNHFYNNDIDISTSKVADSTNVLAFGHIFSEKQLHKNRLSSQNLLLETTWDNNHIAFNSEIEQEQHGNEVRIKGNVDFFKNKTSIKFDSSQILVFNNTWHFDKDNRIDISGKEITFTKFNLSDGSQHIAIDGEISEMTDRTATLKFQDFDISMVNSIITKDLDGTLNGFLKVKKYYNAPIVENELTIDSLQLDGFLVGNVFGKTTWKNEEENLKIKAFVDREGLRTININGYYYPKQLINPLQLRANFDQTNLNLLEPFFSRFFSQINGMVSGVFTMSGSPTKPILKGNGNVANGHIKVDYLNTNYNFDGEFGFSDNQILFHKLNLKDIYNNEGVLTGKITHTNFKNMVMGLRVDIENVQVLNTTSVDNDLFYGTGFATGNIEFNGPIRNMEIRAYAKTNKGTKIFIPIGDNESIEQEDFINFVSLKDTIQMSTAVEDDRIDLRGLKLDFDLDITQDASCEIIFDIKSGDIIRGNGDGRLNLQIDTQGDFNMFGDYVINRGGYNFTLYNIINKEFSIKPESKISWFGDPYQGILDIDATYKQMTSLSPLIDTAYQDVPAVRRNYPVEVDLFIDGPLLSPEIDFDINVKDYPSLVTSAEGETIYLEDEVAKLKRRISIDEQELNRQVFSLVVLRKFSPPESFNTSGSIGNSVSEFISNQLSYWVSQVDENLEVDVDLGSLDEEAFNTFQLRLSYTFLDGRLRVTREGGFTKQEEQEGDQLSGIVGDWTVEYILTKDGKFRAKIYNRTNYNTLNSNLGTTTATTTGVSLMHTQSFEQLRDLLSSARKKQRKNNKEPQSGTYNPALKEDDGN